MKKVTVAIISMLVVSSVFAMKMHKATIIEHKAEITGNDSKGRAINGHLDNGPIVYGPKQKSHKKQSVRVASKNSFLKTPR